MNTPHTKVTSQHSALLRSYGTVTKRFTCKINFTFLSAGSGSLRNINTSVSRNASSELGARIERSERWRGVLTKLTLVLWNLNLSFFFFFIPPSLPLFSFAPSKLKVGNKDLPHKKHNTFASTMKFVTGVMLVPCSSTKWEAHNSECKSSTERAAEWFRTRIFVVVSTYLLWRTASSFLLSVCLFRLF
ncbi:hypothetical protein BKA61DRAFT_66566 [Leptodontidium sp. MPI-SDFR-AT-0119]|nr:hypothetical protein BKA61DRAFT_66566 [Leptodontidium sp. MPI-SDFR-AT-0119]